MNSCYKTTNFFLIYADDIKIFSLINEVPDALAFQGDLVAFAAWSAVV